jgi:hypothetical protein
VYHHQSIEIILNDAGSSGGKYVGIVVLRITILGNWAVTKTYAFWHKHIFASEVVWIRSIDEVARCHQDSLMIRWLWSKIEA